MSLPPYPIFPEVICENIILRQVQPDDIKDLLEISFYDAKPALTVDDAIAMQHKINLDYQHGDCIHWGIAEKSSNNIIGTVGYYRGLDTGIGELGCILKSAFRGKGFMTTAIKASIEFGLTKIGLTKIIAITSRQNGNAIKLLGRLNFTQTAAIEDDTIQYEFVHNFL